MYFHDDAPIEFEIKIPSKNPRMRVHPSMRMPAKCAGEISDAVSLLTPATSRKSLVIGTSVVQIASDSATISGTEPEKASR